LNPKGFKRIPLAFRQGNTYWLSIEKKDQRRTRLLIPAAEISSKNLPHANSVGELKIFPYTSFGEK